MKYEILNGNLVISLGNEADREAAQESLDRASNRDTDFLNDLLEDWTANGHLYAVRPEWIGALTEAPIITDDLTIEDDGTPVVNGDVWWFPDYQVKSFAEELLEKGSITFAAAPENKHKPVDRSDIDTIIDSDSSPQPT